ncbi:hypothetical protein K470DRAFT_140319 [Piedraia hortae CBS 480.64]|uniref:Uncharacterized protein n=1 Tax=Piedraia hortae CBS 480.64 TaxID=1314780 RepID=A0A6A7C6X1_9PEZI|nr:hypothetical protein K470DRAFT_140319 [Piedraia hortae CBS 480.64]
MDIRTASRVSTKPSRFWWALCAMSMAFIMYCTPAAVRSSLSQSLLFTTTFKGKIRCTADLRLKISPCQTSRDVQEDKKLLDPRNRICSGAQFQRHRIKDRVDASGHIVQFCLTCHDIVCPDFAMVERLWFHPTYIPFGSSGGCVDTDSIKACSRSIETCLRRFR